MPTPIIPIKPPTVAQTVRGVTWSVHKEPMFSNIVHTTASGKRSVSTLQTQPLYKFTYEWEFIKDFDVQAGNSPYTDMQVLEGYLLSFLGQATEFLYQPIDSAKTNYTISAPDANGYAAISIDRGGQFREQVQELNGVNPSNIKKNGGSPGATALHAPGTVAGFVGWTITGSPTFLTTDVITCDFTWYYRCALTEDSQDLENWAYNWWSLQKLEFKQIRI